MTNPFHPTDLTPGEEGRAEKLFAEGYQRVVVNFFPKCGKRTLTAWGHPDRPKDIVSLSLKSVAEEQDEAAFRCRELSSKGAKP